MIARPSVASRPYLVVLSIRPSGSAWWWMRSSRSAAAAAVRVVFACAGAALAEAGCAAGCAARRTADAGREVCGPSPAGRTTRLLTAEEHWGHPGASAVGVKVVPHCLQTAMDGYFFFFGGGAL